MEVLDSVSLHFDQQRLWLMNACLGLVMFGVALELHVDDFRRLLQQPRAVAVGLGVQLLFAAGGYLSVGTGTTDYS